MKRILNLLVTALALSASGCSLFPDHRLDYRKAEVTTPMALPPGMAMTDAPALFPVPDPERRAPYQEDEVMQVPEPPALPVLDQLDADPQAESVPAPGDDPTNTRVVLARDGSGYPMIMMYTSYAWAWEYVGQALTETDLRIDDRDRESGLYYLTVPKGYGLDEKVARLKLSQTVNGVQITVLDRKASALVDRGPGQDILQTLYNSL